MDSALEKQLAVRCRKSPQVSWCLIPAQTRERSFPNSQCTGISYQHLRSRRQTIDCWFLWEERKIIKPLLCTDQLEDMAVTSAPQPQYLQGNLSSPFSVAAEGFVQVLLRSPRCVSASHSHCLKRSPDMVCSLCDTEKQKISSPLC